MKTYFPFLLILNIDMPQIIEILPEETEGLVYHMLSILWLLMTWGFKDPEYDTDITLMK